MPSPRIQPSRDRNADPSGDDHHDGSPRRLGWLIAIVVVLGLLLIALLLGPRLVALYWLSWGTDFFKRILYEDLGLSDAWSSSFAVVLSFGYALALAYLLGWSLWRVFSWRASARQVAITFVSYLTVFALPHVIQGVADTWANPGVCFNQRTGEPIKWYVALTGGQVVLYDSGGFDKFGNKKQPATQEVCEIFDQQQRGIRPHKITSPPDTTQFFSPTSGVPLAWYATLSDGSVAFYDEKGFSPDSGELLRPESADVVRRYKQQLVAQEAAAKNQADRQASDAAVLVEEAAKVRLAAIFGTATYARGAVVIGAAPSVPGPTSTYAAKIVIQAFTNAVRGNGRQVDVLRDGVYSDGYFQKLMQGDSASLLGSGLLEKISTAMLIGVSAQCETAEAVSGVVSCTTSLNVQWFTAKSGASALQVSETGAGASEDQAVGRSVELLLERHSDLASKL